MKRGQYSPGPHILKIQEETIYLQENYFSTWNHLTQTYIHVKVCLIITVAGDDDNGDDDDGDNDDDDDTF